MLHSHAAAPHTAAAAAAWPDGKPYPSATATAWASGGRGWASTALNTIVSPTAPAAVAASTTTGVQDRHTAPSSSPAASAHTMSPAGPATVLTAFIAAVSTGVRWAATNRATGWSNRHPVTVGHVVYQRTQHGRGQRDDGQAQHERQHQGAAISVQAARPRAANPADKSPEPPGQFVRHVSGRGQPVRVTSHPFVQPDTGQCHEPADG
jgi:hypothetical protein